VFVGLRHAGDQIDMENQHLQSVKWSSAALAIYSKVLQPDEIGNIFGLKAARTHTKGDRKNSYVPACCIWKDSHWLLKSPLNDQSNLADHLRSLLDLLEPKAAALRQLTEKCKVIWFCGFSSENGQGGFELDPETLSRLAGLNIALVLDLHPPGPIEAESRDNLELPTEAQ
jgi:hypothetical protein